MKKISLILAVAGIVLAIQPARSQSGDTTRNKIEVKKKVKVGVHGRQVTKVKMEGKGTPSAITGSVNGAVNDKQPVNVVTPAPQPRPTVVVVNRQPAPSPAPSTTTVTTTTQAKQVPVTTTRVTKTATNTAHVVHTTRATKPVYRRTVYTRRPAATSSTQTTTTTTVKKE
jgi:hypothetical protein